MLFLKRILDLFNNPRLLHNAFQCATISGNIIWSDFTCVTKVAAGSTKGSTLHFAKSIQISLKLFLIVKTRGSAH